MKPDDPSARVSHETIYAAIYAQPRGGLKAARSEALRQAKPARGETVQNFVPWRILLRHWEAVFEHDCELAFDCVPFAH